MKQNNDYSSFLPIDDAPLKKLFPHLATQVQLQNEKILVNYKSAVKHRIKQQSSNNSNSNDNNEMNDNKSEEDSGSGCNDKRSDESSDGLPPTKATKKNKPNRKTIKYEWKKHTFECETTVVTAHVHHFCNICHKKNE